MANDLKPTPTSDINLRYRDHPTLEAFVRALAKAQTYRSSDLGYEDSISDYWRREAEDWVTTLDAEKPRQVQTSGPQCKQCGGFTTYARVRSHGLCMACENEKKESLWRD